jgi:hypothetical protein
MPTDSLDSPFIPNEEQEKEADAFAETVLTRVRDEIQLVMRSKADWHRLLKPR